MGLIIDQISHWVKKRSEVNSAPFYDSYSSCQTEGNMHVINKLSNKMIVSLIRNSKILLLLEQDSYDYVQDCGYF